MVLGNKQPFLHFLFIATFSVVLSRASWGLSCRERIEKWSNAHSVLRHPLKSFWVERNAYFTHVRERAKKGLLPHVDVHNRLVDAAAAQLRELGVDFEEFGGGNTQKYLVILPGAATEFNRHAAELAQDKMELVFFPNQSAEAYFNPLNGRQVSGRISLSTGALRDKKLTDDDRHEQFHAQRWVSRRKGNRENLAFTRYLLKEENIRSYHTNYSAEEIANYWEGVRLTAEKMIAEPIAANIARFFEDIDRLKELDLTTFQKLLAEPKLIANLISDIEVDHNRDGVYIPASRPDSIFVIRPINYLAELSLQARRQIEARYPLNNLAKESILRGERVSGMIHSDSLVVEFRTETGLAYLFELGAQNYSYDDPRMLTIAKNNLKRQAEVSQIYLNRLAALWVLMQEHRMFLSTPPFGGRSIKNIDFHSSAAALKKFFEENADLLLDPV